MGKLLKWIRKVMFRRRGKDPQKERLISTTEEEEDLNINIDVPQFKLISHVPFELPPRPRGEGSAETTILVDGGMIMDFLNSWLETTCPNPVPHYHASIDVTFLESAYIDSSFVEQEDVSYLEY